MTEPIVVVGAGGFGREVVDVIEAINASSGTPTYGLLGVLDDSPTHENMKRLAARSVEYLGGTNDFLSKSPAQVNFAIGVGNPAARHAIASRFEQSGFTAATLVHPSVTTGVPVSIGPGSVLCAGARLTTNITIGRHVHVNLNATIGHDTVVEDFVSINPLASISGDCCIEAEALVGVGGVVLQGLRIGRGATVGGSACVVKDVDPGVVVTGVPARPRNTGG